jgi:hypothetical protein
MPNVQQQRTKVTTLIPAGHWAIRAAGMEVWIAPPSMLGGPVLKGLSNTAFTHEVLPALPLPHGGIPESSRTVLDVAEQSIGFLKELEKDAAEARRRPTYWGDPNPAGGAGIPRVPDRTSVRQIAVGARRLESGRSAAVSWCGGRSLRR